MDLAWTKAVVRAGPGDAENRVGSFVIEFTVESGADATDVARRWTELAEYGEQLADTADQLDTTAADLLEKLRGLARSTPPAQDVAESGLSAGEEQELRRAGSLVPTMPPMSERASTRTVMRGVSGSRAMLDVKAVAIILGKTQGRIRQRLAEHTLLGVRAGGTWRVPGYQFDVDGELPGWDRVVAGLPQDVHPLTVRHFLDSPHVDLDVGGDALTPRAWLRLGGAADAVVHAAAAMFDVP